ncbi:MAG: NAD-dependent epimerase/dehydratase family protein [Candidatus Limivicinus sp.]|jgi:UDP-glucuronate decarboxylase
MWSDNCIYREDMQYISDFSEINWSKLENKTILVTGATGLIGSLTVNALLWHSIQNSVKIHVLALVRDLKKAKALYCQQLKCSDSLELLQGDVCGHISIQGPLDYIIHTAGPTSSKFFIEHPVDTVRAIVEGTDHMLMLGTEKNISGFLYLSSMEIYGTPQTDEKILETSASNLDLQSARSCYPEAKRAAEALCMSYRKQFGLNAKVLRLTQTFGAGVAYNDNRVFAQFARSAISGSSIVLKTKGETRRSYLYTADAVTAILTALTRETEPIMNAANEDTYCSILEMAQMVARENGIGVSLNLAEDACALGYAPVLHMNLDTGRLRSTGWTAGFNLKVMFARMIACMQ